MINNVIKAISTKINSFRDKSTTKIYMETVEQDFQQPCFFIKELRSSQIRELGNRYKRGHFYDIHYFPNPESNSKNQEMREIAETMYDQMEFIEVNGKLTMGLDMNHQTIDGVLHFFVKYPFHVYKQVEKIPTMETLSWEGEVKDD